MSEAMDVTVVLLAALGFMTIIAGIVYAIAYVVNAKDLADQAHRRCDHLRDDFNELNDKLKGTK